jgi:uncharacterized protein YndB with AHSA1/START domain
MTITRTFAASRDLIFRMWTDASHRARWWGPRDFAGFGEIAAPKRLTFIARDADGIESHNTVTFEEKDGRTTLVVTAIGTIA